MRIIYVSNAKITKLFQTIDIILLFFTINESFFASFSFLSRIIVNFANSIVSLNERNNSNTGAICVNTIPRETTGTACRTSYDTACL